MISEPDKNPLDKIHKKQAMLALLPQVPSAKCQKEGSRGQPLKGNTYSIYNRVLYIYIYWQAIYIRGILDVCACTFCTDTLCLAGYVWKRPLGVGHIFGALLLSGSEGKESSCWWPGPIKIVRAEIQVAMKCHWEFLLTDMNYVQQVTKHSTHGSAEGEKLLVNRK